MDLHYYSSSDCYDILKTILPKGFFLNTTTTIGDKSIDYYLLGSSANLTYDAANFLVHLCGKVDGIEAADKYSKPMVWIGLYIAAASFYCTAAMAADLMHAFRNRKLWFPCYYFSLNAASITVISVAMKLTLDMTTPMNDKNDQAAKLGSLAFICTIMANSMPSLASMSSKSLVANAIGLVILVITIIVNVCIEITTGVIDRNDLSVPSLSIIKVGYIFMVYIYLTMMLCLLLLTISSAITIPTFKKILEFKYQQAIKKTTSNDQNPQHIHNNSVDQLTLYVTRYWMMIQTSNPQFVIARNPLSFASNAISIANVLLLGGLYHNKGNLSFQSSDYKGSTYAIFIIQIIGIGVGNTAPVYRVLCFKFIPKSSRNFLMYFKVEKYWTHKLHEWKEHQILFLSGYHRSKKLVRTLKIIILRICIEFQKLIVVSSKMIQLIVEVIAIFYGYCSYLLISLIAMVCITPIASTNDNMSEGIHNYVLQLEDEMRLTEEALKNISRSVSRLITNAEKEQHNNFLTLLENLNGFRGVENFDTDQVQPLLSVKLSNNWSLPIVTLTCIAISLPNIHKDISDTLFKSVGEGLYYTRLVEESLNSATEYVNIHKAATNLWQEVEDDCKWLANSLKRSAYYEKTPVEILKWFADEAKDIVMDIYKVTDDTDQVENFPSKLIAANSMYRIAQTILLKHERNIDPIREEELFVLLYGMIADILVACLSNIPRVIRMKCNESVIEKRVASVEVAVKLLGRSTEIIKRLEACELPNMDPDKMGFIDEWRLHLKQSIQGRMNVGSRDPASLEIVISGPAQQEIARRLIRSKTTPGCILD